MTSPRDNLPVVFGEVLVHVALDEGGLPGAQLADDQHLDIALTILDQGIKCSTITWFYELNFDLDPGSEFSIIS